MKNLPLIPKVLINVILLGIYFVIWSVIAAIIYGVVWMVLGYNIPKPTDPVFDKIGIVALVVTIVITAVYRKYFYMPLTSEEMEEEKTPTKKKKHDFSME